ncbi:CIR protein [Plasmodium chabaudi chabaudi]|uniref:CIR protein n=1 Tax=Plasmodium chabaudi chabaudi TaxID=31271 RepID=A0A1C6WC29_PLACU|nr:CIR protein [Plasmodium chabaudi chabaudi]
MSKKLCGLINVIDNGVKVTMNDTSIQVKNNDKFSDYCSPEEMKSNGECDSIIQIVNSAIITLLKHFKNAVNDDALESGKLDQYAILWLSYKLNLMSYDGIINLNDFHNKYIKGKENEFQKITDAEAYRIYNDLINKKDELMEIDIKIISKFYEALKILCKLYNEIDADKSKCTKCLQTHNEFDKSFENLNNDSSINGKNSYTQLLSTLSYGYDNLKKECKDSLSLRTIEKVQNIAQGSDDTSSNSSIASKLIPGLLAFAIPFFLGVAYKYSLFGFDKRLHRQYLREKLKKIKKKMASYV